MAKAMLSANEVAFARSALDYNPDTGVFVWRFDRTGRAKAGTVAGTPLDGYVRIKVGGRFVLAHRLAWFFIYGEWPSSQIDHINGVRHDNRVANLRACDQSQNMANKKRHENNKAGLKGVSWDLQTQKWKAQLTKNKTKIHIGFFENKHEAHQAYVDAAIIHHGEFARAA